MLIKIEAASSGPVSLAKVIKYCNAPEDGSDDELLTDMLDDATEMVAERVSLALGPTVYRVDRGSWWSGCIQILVAPVRDIASVKYFDENGVLQTVSSSLYRWKRTDVGATLELLADFTSPALEADRDDSIQIEVEAGFDDPYSTGAGDDPELVCPGTIKQAIRALVSFWYDNREAASDKDFRAVPLHAEALMAQARVYR